MEVHEFSDILQDIAHEGKAKYKLKINGIEFNHEDLKIIRNSENNIVEINIKNDSFPWQSNLFMILSYYIKIWVEM